MTTPTMKVSPWEFLGLGTPATAQEIVMKRVYEESDPISELSAIGLTVRAVFEKHYQNMDYTIREYRGLYLVTRVREAFEVCVVEASGYPYTQAIYSEIATKVTLPDDIRRFQFRVETTPPSGIAEIVTVHQRPYMLDRFLNTVADAIDELGKYEGELTTRFSPEQYQKELWELSMNRGWDIATKGKYTLSVSRVPLGNVMR
ncbi:MAG: hypothetical protein SFZ02_12320 [bacterium]|nr:hypothetical protein [bacterium]